MFYGTHDPQAAANGFGAYFTQQAPILPMAGVGDDMLVVVPDEADAVAPAATATTALIWILLRTSGGYVVGRAMAPDVPDRGTWGAVGAVFGLLGGPAALGLMGLLALRSKR